MQAEQVEYGVFEMVTGEWLMCHSEMNSQYETKESAERDYDWLCRSKRLDTLPVGTRFEDFHHREPFKITRKDGGIVHVTDATGNHNSFCACATGVVIK
jgi:hypothetical protein